MRERMLVTEGDLRWKSTKLSEKTEFNGVDNVAVTQVLGRHSCLCVLTIKLINLSTPHFSNLQNGHKVFVLEGFSENGQR